MQHDRGWPGVSPASTYRLQLHAGFGFADAAALADYLADLGVSHAYLSPILQAAPGSAHGYDVVDHSRISADLGGERDFRSMAEQLAAHGIGIVADVVPNHMAIPAPEYLNQQLWSVLRDGRNSASAHWFDIDWAARDDRILLPILAGPLRACIGDLSVTRLSALSDPSAPPPRADDDEAVLCYQRHVLPLRPGTAGLPTRQLLAAQHYQLDHWRAASAALNWRRFADVSSLIAIRVEEPDVFFATHAVLLGLVAEGIVDGLRIDHPDGLADPRRYLEQLAVATRGRWVTAEKILGPGEVLPADWRCAGTTGYDALAAVGALFTDPAGVGALGREYTRSTGGPPEFAPVAWTARREIAGQLMTAEVARLARLAQRTGEPLLAQAGARDLRFILAEMLAAFDVYRPYLVPGSPPPETSARQIAAAATRARLRMPARLRPALGILCGVLLGRDVPDGGENARDDLITVLQQTCAAIQAKGVEDTAFYRWSRLLSANEVGADPDRPAGSLADFHGFAARLARDWPATMTTLSTHDTKRQEDVRARLAVLAEVPQQWAHEVTAWHTRAAQLACGLLPDRDTEYLLWQTLVGSWPIGADRLTSYLLKAMREAKTATSWHDPDTRYEAAVLDLARVIVADEALAERIGAFAASITPDANANSLGAKLVQLTMPGVPDVYQGCELAGFALVDPDNRGAIDFARRRGMLAAILGTTAEAAYGAGGDPRSPRESQATVVARTSLDAGKLLVCTRALRLRREHPDWFAGGYDALDSSGSECDHVVAFGRAGQCVTVATRLPARLRRNGGWRDTSLRLPPGRWHDLLTGATHAGRGVPLADLTASLPVALLVRTADGQTT
jgi:(1->4)-alpha-D-glucan 1-alpha-D-glucosylmutase